ncbi:MAG: glutamine-hydrolyzing carbamoyl-phosphate synthase small subunit [bacterium]|nr:glutamine-hydrolyzing carbamoyl-phosphate synthase small subunit [bacterium]
MQQISGKLIFEDKTVFTGMSFGAPVGRAGEVVFSTGMVGYPESLTDPSYKGQILVLTYPLIGSYGVPNRTFWESDSIMVSGLVVGSYIDTPSHFQSCRTLAEWLRGEKIPLLEIKDTRLLAQKIRDRGTLLGKIVFDKDIPFYDPNKENLVAQVSGKKVILQKPHSAPSAKTILLIDCGAKRNIQRKLSERGVNVIIVPWNFDPFAKQGISFDGIVVSNGPGDPKYVDKTIATIKKALDLKIPLLGICLGHQLLSLAAGGNTKKLKYGHRGQNQPCIMEGSPRCFITTQNHGFAVSEIPPGFKPWFTNANDSSNEGMIHRRYPFMSVQFHPEAAPGPVDTEWIFDYFLEKIK